MALSNGQVLELLKMAYFRGSRLAVFVLLAFIWIAALLHQRQVFHHFHRTSPKLSNHESAFGGPLFSNGKATQAGRLYQQPAMGPSASSSPTSQPYTIKPIAYVFPQFHAIPENDRFWGTNFTEWTNVRRVATNLWGQEVQQPTDEVGYYDMLDYNTRARQAKLVRDSGLYGIVFHHYWFSGPVMDRVLLAMLEDGQPDVPFMLSWANEPWNKRWDGTDDGEILLKQLYGGVDEWRRHFDWLVQFFKHPNYIRANGGKLQFMVYNTMHSGDLGKRMFAAWRQWADEEGLGGLEIIETSIDGDNPNDRGLCDATNEFGFRSGGAHDGTLWPSLPRMGTVHHRGAAVSWDNSPRYPLSGSTCNPFAHPRLWELQMVEMMRRIKSDPNQRGQENFFFINALNEWGEGNVLEPSRQWGDGFSAAFRSAVETAASLPWRDELFEPAAQLGKDLNMSTLAGSPYGSAPHEPLPPASDVDVCVVVRVFRADWDFSDPFGPTQLLKSLRAQTNRRWRAVVVRATPQTDERILRVHVMDALDPRVSYLAVPPDVLAAGDDSPSPGAWTSAEWAIDSLWELAPDCGAARYLLVANGNTTYSPDTFDVVTERTGGDIVGLNFESVRTLRETTKDATRLIPASPEDPSIGWDWHCERLKVIPRCVAATTETSSDLLDVGAVLLNLWKFVNGRHSFSANAGGSSFGASVMDDLSREGWSWTLPVSPGCNMVEGRSYSSCISSGRFWLDAPDHSTKYVSECHSVGSIMNKYGGDLSQWDMVGWKKNPFCLRISRSAYAEEVNLGS